MIDRQIEKKTLRDLCNHFPVTALVGPRQCGKTTLARQMAFREYFDLENPRDQARLDQPQTALENLAGLVVIDEIQRKPDLFPLMRYLVDARKDLRFLVLGSASADLLRQGSESLAGRIAFHRLGGLSLHDVGSAAMGRLWVRGGFPLSFTADTDEASMRWRSEYVTTFLERDIPQLGIRIPSNALRRFWTMLSHYHGQVLNYAELGRSFGLSDVNVRRYIDVLESTFMVRTLQPWFVNVGKRLVKRPKLYLRDSGIFHSLLTIGDQGQLFTHNKLGASWEGFALETVCSVLRKRSEECFFWATHAGAELDLFWQDGGKNWGVEFKYQDAPVLTKSMSAALADLELAYFWVVYPGDKRYRLGENVTVLPLLDVGVRWEYPG